MPRKQLLISHDDPCHVTARCVNREWFDLPLPTVWSIMEDYLFLISGEYTLRIHSFVLMPNHFHLAVTAPQGNLSQAMMYFMRETSREITRLSGRINQTYGARHHKSRIPNYHYFRNTYKYIYRNPVRAGLCKRVEEYPFSTFAGLCGLARLTIPVVEDAILFTPCFNEIVLQWLNTAPDLDSENQIRKALKRPEFALCTARKTGRPSSLETSLL